MANSKDREKEYQRLYGNVPIAHRKANTGYSEGALSSLDNGNYKDYRQSTSVKNASARIKERESRVPELSQQAEEATARKNIKKQRASFNSTTENAWNNIGMSSDDEKFLKNVVDRFGYSAPSILKNSSKTSDWEQKYGTSFDEIYNKYVDHANNQMVKDASESPILGELQSAIPNIVSGMTGSNQALAELIAPNSGYAEAARKINQETNDAKARLRTGVDEAWGEAGTIRKGARDISDQLLPALGASVLGGKVGAALTAGSLATNRKLNELEDRGIDGRSKAAQALLYGGIEGGANALTAGAFDKVPTKSLLGTAIKNGASGAVENLGAEIIEQNLDKALGKDKSEWATNKAIAMSQGMSESDAEKYADSMVKSAYKTAGIAGGLFGSLGSVVPYLKKQGELDDIARQDILNKYALGEPKADVQNVETAKSGVIDSAPAPSKSIEQELSDRIKRIESELGNAESGSLEQYALLEELADARNDLIALRGKSENISDNLDVKNQDGTIVGQGQQNADLTTKQTGGTANPDTKTSQTYSNTAKNSGIETKEEFKKNTPEELFQYEAVHEKETNKIAVDDINERGVDAVESELMSRDMFGAVDTDKAMHLWRKFVREARGLDNAGADSSAAWTRANSMLKKVQSQLTEKGQAIQALAKWTRNTPEGLLMDAQRMVNNALKSKGIKKLLGSVDETFEFSADFQKQFLDIADRLSMVDDIDSREGQILAAELGKLTASQIPNTVPEKVTALLMDNMLGNFRTLITRNAGGNIGFGVLEQIKKPIASTLDSLLSKITGKRTTANWSKSSFKEYMDGFAYALANEKADFKSDLHTGRSGAKDTAEAFEDAVNSNRHIFNNKILDTYDKLVKHGLSVGDRPFYEGTYRQTLAEYNQLREQGVLSTTLMELSDEQFDEAAKAAAKLNALAAVYQDDTLLSKGLLGIKEGLGKVSEGAIGVDVLSQFSMPFVKTPANLIVRAIEYSPLGFVKNAVSSAREIYGAGDGLVDSVSKGLDQSRFVNETARNILGTGLFGAGVAMANNGTMSGSYSDDKDMAQAQKNAGMQEYALHGNGKYMDISWVPVLGNTLVSAAATKDAMDKSDGSLAKNIETGAKAGLESLMSQSVFQGVQRLFGGNNSYNSDEGIISNVFDTVKSGASQAIPSLVRQTAQTLDPYERDVTGDYYTDNLLASLPGMRETLQTKVDTEGNTVLSNQGRGLLSRAIENMILPGKITEDNSSLVNDEAMRIFTDTNGADVTAFMPKVERKDMKAGSVGEYEPTDREFNAFKSAVGKGNTEAGELLIKDSSYALMSDTEKADALSSIYQAVKAAEKNKLNNGYKSTDKAVEAYESGGAEALKDYVVDMYSAKQLGVDVSTYRKKQQEYPGGAAQYVQDKQDAVNYGFVNKSGEANLDAYNEALEIVGNDANALNEYALYKHQGYSKNNEKIPVLMDSSFSDEQKGMILVGTDPTKINGKVANEVYNSDGYSGLYYYYLLKYLADTDGNGSVKKAERQALFSDTSMSAYLNNLSQEMQDYLYSNLK